MSEKKDMQASELDKPRMSETPQPRVVLDVQPTPPVKKVNDAFCSLHDHLLEAFYKACIEVRGEVTVKEPDQDCVRDPAERLYRASAALEAYYDLLQVVEHALGQKP